MSLPKLDKRVAFVAGASRGIGRDIAKALAGAGASVAVAARTEEPGKLAGTIYSVADAIGAAGRERGPGGVRRHRRGLGARCGGPGHR